MADFDELIAEALRAPLVGWNFDWLQGRATEERPTWGYSERARSALAAASSALDIDTGGGEVLAYIGGFPPQMVATEGWPPNVSIARERLEPLGVRVVQTDDAPALPFGSESFDLVLNRHGLRGRAASAEARAWWREVARVLRPGGTFLSQQVGGKGMRELREALGLPATASSRPWDAGMAYQVIGRPASSSRKRARSSRARCSSTWARSSTTYVWWSGSFPDSLSTPIMSTFVSCTSASSPMARS